MYWPVARSAASTPASARVLQQSNLLNYPTGSVGLGEIAKVEVSFGTGRYRRHSFQTKQLVYAFQFSSVGGLCRGLQSVKLRIPGVMLPLVGNAFH